jgi:hypothetical protein
VYERFLWEPFTKRTALSARLIEGLDIAKVPVIEKYDGKSLRGAYVVPT